ncbi:MAG: CPBP family intramembrane metalloprotease [Clostridia bacterium]|nr:CPBP family intramembrane metalloprotease [Clostridia bacterium]
MNNQPEFDSSTFDAGSGKKIRSYFSRIGLGLALMLVVATAVQLLAVKLIDTYAPAIRSTDWFIWALSLLPMYLCGLPIFLICIRRAPVMAPEKHKIPTGHWFIILLMCFGVMYAGNYLGTYITFSIDTLLGRETTSVVSNALASSSPIFNFIAAVIIAPILEELVFRRLIIDRTRAYGEKTAIVFSGLLFGLYHGNLQQFFYAFGLGMLFAYVYTRTGKLRYTVLLHMVINFFGSIVAMFVLNAIDLEAIMAFAEQMVDAEYVASLSADPEAYAAFINEFIAILPGMLLYLGYALLVFGAAIAGVVLFFVKKRRFIFKPAEFQLPRERVGNTVYFNLGVFTLILICAVMMVSSLM